MFIHGRYYEPEYRAWVNMIKRCTEARWAQWYGPITVCEKWRLSYNAFLEDVGRRPSKLHSLDRIESSKGYEPGNVRWSTKAVQSRNTKNHSTNKTGIRGVSWSKEKKKWRAHISVGNKSKHLGYFDTTEQAAEARASAEKQHW